MKLVVKIIYSILLRIYSEEPTRKLHREGLSPIRHSLDIIPRKATALNFDKDIYMTCSIYNQLYIFYMSSDNDPIRRNSHTFEYPLSLMLELWMLPIVHLV